jgi:hypothetical protein
VARITAGRYGRQAVIRRNTDLSALTVASARGGNAVDGPAASWFHDGKLAGIAGSAPAQRWVARVESLIGDRLINADMASRSGWR